MCCANSQDSDTFRKSPALMASRLPQSRAPAPNNHKHFSWAFTPPSIHGRAPAQGSLLFRTTQETDQVSRRVYEGLEGSTKPRRPKEPSHWVVCWVVTLPPQTPS